MTYRTVVLSSFEAFLADEYAGKGYSEAGFESRREMLSLFPHPVMLKLSFAELDYANRWCWHQFGSPRGECFDPRSTYPTCHIQDPHCHSGTWAHEWFEKIDYDFGYNEWYFSSSTQMELFLDFVPQINWGEKYPVVYPVY